jgi:hypothetical protein
MGNTPSQNQYQQENMNMKKINSPPKIMKFNEDEIFQKILNISNQLFDEFNNDFLKEDFCSKISLIYEKKLSNFNIKLLKSLYDNINSNVSNREIIATLQYIPKNDEKFIDISDMFKENLYENFWNKNIILNKSKILPENIKLKKENINEINGQFGKKYIQFKHVNNLLSSKNKKNNENNGNNQNNNNETKNLTKLVGGFIKKNNKLIKKFNKKRGGGNDKEEEDDEDEEEVVNNEEGNNLSRSSQYITEVPNNLNSSNNNSTRRNNNSSRRNNNGVTTNSIVTNGVVTNGVVTNGVVTNGVTTNGVTTNGTPTNAISTNIRNNSFKNNSTKINIVQPTSINNSNKRSNNITRMNNSRKNNILSIQPVPIIVPTNSKNLAEKTNEIILKNEKIEVPPETTKETFVNSLIKYSVPRSYEKPIHLCKGKEGEKCKLSKKDLCTAITQNFIVRNNIIAAILSTIPYKNESGEYEGGICYQRFLNLEKCKVCVPFEYISLKNKPIDYILEKILEKADFLDEKKCNENKGYFFTLSPQEKKILTSKAIDSVKNGLTNKTNYNLLFMESTEKLKRTYFENLNSLITILEKMKETPIINNKTLNIISKETKTCIDNMYNLCYYYYIYGIIALIFSEIKENVPQENSIGKFISNSVKK